MSGYRSRVRAKANSKQRREAELKLAKQNEAEVIKFFRDNLEAIHRDLTDEGSVTSGAETRESIEVVK